MRGGVKCQGAAGMRVVYIYRDQVGVGEEVSDRKSCSRRHSRTERRQVVKRELSGTSPRLGHSRSAKEYATNIEFLASLLHHLDHLHAR